VEELVEDGASIKLSNDNKEYYCMLYADYLINKSVSKQFIAFKRGFNRVVSGGIIETFEPEELRVLIGGIEEIDMKELEESTQYEGGYTKDTPVIKYSFRYTECSGNCCTR
jgi:ubiquitin-protein ligase E3 A